MTTTSAEQRITAMIRTVDVDADPRSGEVLWRMRSDDGRIDVTYGDPTRPFFIASATRLFVTTILAQLRAEGRVDWATPLATYLPDLNLTDLVVVRGQDRCEHMTVREVMAHTSGLADYFEGRRPDGPTTFARVVEADFGWNVHHVLAWTRAMKPGTPGRGRYSESRPAQRGHPVAHPAGHCLRPGRRWHREHPGRWDGFPRCVSRRSTPRSLDAGRAPARLAPDLLPARVRDRHHAVPDVTAHDGLAPGATVRRALWRHGNRHVPGR